MLKDSLNNAKRKHGAIRARFLKLFCTGSGAAGKTSFIQLLLKKKINEKHHSTNVAHTSHAVSVRTAAFHGSDLPGGCVEWIEMDQKLELNFLRSALLPPDLPRIVKPSAVTSTDEDSAPIAPVKSDLPPVEHTQKLPKPPKQKKSHFKSTLFKVFKTTVKDKKNDHI